MRADVIVRQGHRATMLGWVMGPDSDGLAQEATNRNELGAEPSWRWRSRTAGQPGDTGSDTRTGSS
ncbi:hypothetical protein C6376_17615 [Streptomyces sp. P3]|nr:hypothetical protein C6376_17615 [Streptomyces sp. P3]